TSKRDWSSDVCSSDLHSALPAASRMPMPRHPQRDDRLGRRHAARREVPCTSPLDAVHAYAGPGTCAATLQIDDDAGATSLATLSVPVSTPIAVLQAIVADLDCPCI